MYWGGRGSWGKCKKMNYLCLVKPCRSCNVGNQVLGDLCPCSSPLITPHLKDMGWLTVQQTVMERDMAMLHHLLHSPYATVSLCDHVTRRSDVSERETRSSVAGALQLPRVRTEHGRRSFPFRAVTTWNTTVPAVREARTWSLCRKELRVWMGES